MLMIFFLLTELFLKFLKRCNEKAITSIKQNYCSSYQVICSKFVLCFYLFKNIKSLLYSFFNISGKSQFFAYSIIQLLIKNFLYFMLILWNSIVENIFFDLSLLYYLLFLCQNCEILFSITIVIIFLSIFMIDIACRWLWHQ